MYLGRYNCRISLNALALSSSITKNELKADLMSPEMRKLIYVFKRHYTKKVVQPFIL